MGCFIGRRVPGKGIIPNPLRAKEADRLKVRGEVISLVFDRGMMTQAVCGGSKHPTKPTSSNQTDQLNPQKTNTQLQQERAVYEAGRTIDLEAIPFRPGDRVDVLQVRLV